MTECTRHARCLLAGLHGLTSFSVSMPAVRTHMAGVRALKEKDSPVTVGRRQALLAGLCGLTRYLSACLLFRSIGRCVSVPQTKQAIPAAGARRRALLPRAAAGLQPAGAGWPCPQLLEGTTA